MFDKNMHRFLKVLHHLYVEQGIELKECLEIMGKQRKNRVSRAAQYVDEELRRGNAFSNALRTCPFISFDSIAVTFVYFSQRTGNLSAMLCFLKERCERKEKAASKIFEASVYPVFVILLSLFVSALMIFYAESALGNNLKKTELLKTLCIDFSFLFFFCGFMFWLLKKNLCDSPLYEAFLSVGFLIKYGVNASVAVGLGANILGTETKAGRVFLKARQRMEGGIGLVKAFSAENKLHMDKEIQEALYYAQKSGGKNDVFERIARLLGKKIERKSALLLSLVEPVFVGGTGVFLIILMANFLMPVMNGLNLM